jgi:sugar phosphate isomerase/epimerase
MTHAPWPLSATQWTTRETDPARAIDRIAAAGYDAIELAADPSADGAALARAVRDAGLRVSSLCAVYSLERDCADADPALRASAVRYLHGCVELADAVGAPVIVVVPSYRVKWEYDRAAELDRAAQTLVTIAADIPPGGPVLALEALNRYEAHLLTTLDEAEELRAMIGHPQVALMADLFHMNIEEDKIAGALRTHSDRIVHVHLADNQRRHPGSGHLDFAEAFATLRENGYTGALAMEFLPATDAALTAGLAHVRGVLKAG